ncbi:MAG: alpha/beta hydrolase-fold protein [Spirosomataceae bacterium]|jgi:predicted esterase
MKIMKLGLLMALLTFSFKNTYSQKLKTGPQVLSFHSDVDDTEQPYAIYIPKSFSEKKTYPLVVMLHGAGSNHRLALKRVFGKSNQPGENDVEASLYFPKWKDVEYIVVSPLARGTMGYQGVAEKDVWDMIADVKKRFSIDEDRTYLTGLSMGGGGTMWLGLTRPDFWAAIAPVCPAPPAATEIYLENATNLNVHFFQGTDDPAVKVEGTRKWVEDFKKVGAKVQYAEYPGVKHDSWVNAYKDEFIFSWFNKFVRDKYPSKVKLSTAQLKYNKAYWVEIVDKEVGKTAKVNAHFKNKNQLDITTENVNVLSIDILDHPNFNKKSAMQLNIDGQNISVFGLANGQVLLKNNDRWAVGKRPEMGSIKNQTTEGPMSEIIADRQIYVYGTEGNPAKEELEKRRKIAEQAADWSFYRGDFLGRVMVFPRVLSDKEVRPSDIERSNLILFGDASTNSVIAKYAEKLPMSLKKGNEASLTYIYPNGKRYILINSGLPFWEIPDNATGLAALLRSSSKMGVLQGLGDWVLYDSAINNVIGTGLFDKNWQLTDKDKELLKNTGKVDLK